MHHEPRRAVVSAFWPYTASQPHDFVRWTDLVNETSCSRLWTGQTAGINTSAAVALAAGVGCACPLGLAVGVMPLTTPFATAVEARTIAAMTRSRFLACYSPGDPRLQNMVHGAKYASPLTATREFFTITRDLLAGEHVDVAGRWFTFHGRLPRLPYPAEVDLGLGVLRPKMAELAGELADVAATWLTVPDYLTDVILPALDAGAARAGRPRPHVVVPVHAAVAAPDRNPHRLAAAAVGKHLRTPTYRDMLARAGQDDVLDDGHTAALRSGLVTYGTPEDIAARVAEVAATGVDEVPIVLHHPRGLPWADVLAEWQAVSAAAVTAVTAERQLSA